MEGMKDGTDPRVLTVGSITGLDNSVDADGVYRIADLYFDMVGRDIAEEVDVADLPEEWSCNVVVVRYMARHRRPRGSTGPQWHKLSSDTRFVGVDGLRVEDGHGWSSSGKWRGRFSRASLRLSISIFGGLNFSSEFLSISRRSSVTRRVFNTILVPIGGLLLIPR